MILAGIVLAGSVAVWQGLNVAEKLAKKVNLREKTRLTGVWN